MIKIQKNWKIESVPEFDEWFEALNEISQNDIYTNTIVLSDIGPSLGRPYVDTLHGSKYDNLKELRVKTDKHVIRIFFAFNKQRTGILLIGGDKRGNDKRFYKELIPKAEELYKKYIE